MSAHEETPQQTMTNPAPFIRQTQVALQFQLIGHEMAGVVVRLQQLGFMSLATDDGDEVSKRAKDMRTMSPGCDAQRRHCRHQRVVTACMYLTGA